MPFRVFIARLAGAAASIALVWAVLAQLGDERTTLVTGWLRWVLIGTILLASMTGIVLLQSVVGANAGKNEPLFGRHGRGPRFRAGLLIVTVGFVLYFAAAQQLDQRVGIPRGRTLLAGMGIGLGWCTVRRPWWFWEHSKARFLRSLVGDRPTLAIYLLIAGACLYLACFGDQASLPW